MANFNPAQHKTPPGQERRGFIDTPGKYVIVLTKLSERGVSQNKGTPFVRFAARCIAGPAKGKTMPVTFWLTDRAMMILGSACEAMGVEDPFDVDDDRSLTDALLHQPMKVQVTLERNGAQTYSKIGSFLSFSDLSKQEREEVSEWQAKNAERVAAAGSAGDSFGAGDFDGGGGDGGDDFPPDDIPF